MAGRVLTSFLYFIGVVLYYIGASALVRFLGRRNPKVLLYHDCAQEETSYTAGLNCTTSPETFAAHLDYLRKHHNVVPVHDIAAGIAPSSSVAITFDDGYCSVYHNAFPLLAERGLPATVYLISNVIGNADLVWVNELNHALRTAPGTSFGLIGNYFPGAPRDGAAKVIDHCRLSYDAKRMQALLAALRTALSYTLEQHADDAQLYVSWDQIDEMRASGIDFGNHTKSHPNLECLSREEQIEEIEGAQQILAEHIPGVRSFAYPFGHHSSETKQIASELGLESVAEVGGYNRPVSPLGVGRVHLSKQSVRGLFAHMEVIEPVKGFLRARLRKRRFA